MRDKTGSRGIEMPRRGTILIAAGIILALGTTVVVFALLRTSGQAPPAPPQATPEAKISVVIAAQEIPALTEIPADAVGTLLIPKSALTPEHLLDPQAVVGKKALTTIVRGSFITTDILLDESKVLELGYNASLNIPPGKVATAFRTSQLRAVAGAVQNGDFVDILISYWMLDTEAQPTPAAGGEAVEAPTSYILLAQLLLQDVEVLRVGPWAGVAVPPEAPPEEAPAAEPTPEATPAAGEGEGELAPVALDQETVLTLLLDQQDALVLKYARESGASIDLVLRGRGDDAKVRTETVSLEYVMTRFEMTVPPEPMRFVPKSYRP
jgi:Flp pilus assembly protein CpaB